MKKIIIMLIIITFISALSISALDIISPINTSYNYSEIVMIVEGNQTLDNISYAVDNNSLILACVNCSNYNTTLNLSEGNHSIEVVGILGNITISDNVTFSIITIIPDEIIDFSIEIIEPKNITYNTSIIPVNVSANETLDSLSLKVDNVFEVLCVNCSDHTRFLNLTEDDYTIVFRGIIDNVSKDFPVHFSVNLEEEPEIPIYNRSYNWSYNHSYNWSYNQSQMGPRFDLGFEKLPQAIENGELTDAQLAEIIRNNNLNPGVLNRLIKTGMLGDESINAILETQFQPPGIFKKLMFFIGFTTNTYSAQIYETYNLTEKQEEKMISREDVPRKYAKQIKEKHAWKENNTANVKSQGKGPKK